MTHTYSAQGSHGSKRSPDTCMFFLLGQKQREMGLGRVILARGSEFLLVQSLRIFAPVMSVCCESFMLQKTLLRPRLVADQEKSQMPTFVCCGESSDKIFSPVPILWPPFLQLKLEFPFLQNQWRGCLARIDAVWHAPSLFLRPITKRKECSSANGFVLIHLPSLRDLQIAMKVTSILM